MSERLLKRILNADAIALCLIFMAIQVLLYGVESAIHGIQIHQLFWICLGGALIGLWGGKSRSNGRQMSAAIVALGLLGVWILGARIADPLVKLIWAVIDAGPQIIPHIRYRFDVDANVVISSWNAIGFSSAALMIRLQTWLLGTTKNFQVNDVLIQNMIWTFGLWLLSAWIGWFAAKRNGMTSLLPGAILLTLLLWSNERRVESLWAFAMIMLLLMGVWNYKNHIQHWETKQIDYSDSIHVDVGESILMVAVVVGFVSYITPSVSWHDVRDYFREREQLKQNEVVIQPVKDTNAASQSGKLAFQSSLPRQHLLTAGYAQSEKIVMTIKTGELPPGAMQSLTAPIPRYYWRSVVYDQYDDRGWFTTAAPSQSFAANEPMIAGVLNGYRLLHLHVQMQQPEARLYWSGMLYSADIPLKVEWRLRPKLNLFADQAALLEADMFAARADATTYGADVFVPIPSVEELRAASADDYPQHIRTLYLSLPETLPQRVHRLAGEITEGKATPYDKAKAIETYLRTNYPYDLKISAPPEDRDVADYFLFDLKRGYCDYYATAMVVLARSSGIPARFVSGYASGDYDVNNAQYVVRELHAHSWAEIYFPEIGWIEFEPTGNQPEIERAETNLQSAANDGPGSISNGIYLQLTNWKTSGLFIPVGIVVVVMVIYFVFIEPLFFANLAPAAAIELLYQHLYRSARPLAGKQTHAETAHEFMNKLIQTIQMTNSEFKRSPYTLQMDIKDLTAIYQNALFSNHHIEHHDVRRALKIWKRLRWSLIMARIKFFFWMRNRVSQ